VTTCAATPARSRSPAGVRTSTRTTCARRRCARRGRRSASPPIATNYSVYPFVGLIESGHEWAPSAFEVELVLELPLADLRAGYDRRRLLRRGVPFRTDTYVVGEHLVWGATARILADLLERVDAAGLA